MISFAKFGNGFGLGLPDRALSHERISVRAVKLRPFTQAIVTIAALATIAEYLISHGLAVSVRSDRGEITWTIETKEIEWQPIAISSLILAALYTGRIDWVIDAAERWANRDAKTNDISQGKNQ